MKYNSYQETGYSWFPFIPEHWHLMKNGAIFKKHQNKVGDNFSNYELLSLTTNGIKRKDINDVKGKVPVSYEGYQEVHIGDIVLCLFDLDCSAVFSGLSKYEGMITSAYEALTPSDSIANARYLDYWFQYVFFNRNYKIYSKSVRYTINYDIFKAIKTPIPPREEQDQIVRYLDWQIFKINKLIAAKKRQIVLLEEQEKVIVNGAVLHGLHHSELVDSGNKWVGHIPANWDVINLGKFCSFQNGISESGDFFTSGTPFVSYGDVYRHLELPVTVKGMAKANSQQQEVFSVRAGDIFFTRTSENIEEIGMAAVCKKTIENAVFSGFIIRCRPRKRLVDIDFLKFYLQSIAVRNHFSSMMNIVIRASLGQNLLKQMPVVLPPMEEQKEIAEYLDELHLKYSRIKDSYQSEIVTLEEYKTKLISDVVTGQIDVRGIEIPEYDYVADSSDEESEDDEEVTELEQDE